MPMTFGSNKRAEAVNVEPDSEAAPSDDTDTPDGQAETAPDAAMSPPWAAEGTTTDDGLGDTPVDDTPQDEHLGWSWGNWATLDDASGTLVLDTHGPLGVAPGELPDIVTYLYEVADQPAPIILDAPRNPDFQIGQVIHGGDLEVSQDHAWQTRVSGSDKTGYTENGSRLDPEQLRTRAVQYAALADWLDNRPDPEQHADTRRDLIDLGLDGQQADAVAYGLLRAGYRKGQPS